MVSSYLLLLSMNGFWLPAPPVSMPSVEKDVVYASPGGVPQKMDIYLPAPSASPDSQKAKKVGMVVYVHGGAWMGGDKAEGAELCDLLAKNGILAATINYRLAPKDKWPAMIDDCQTAVRYFRSNAAKYNLDPERIAAAGASAGGHLSLLLGFRDTRDPKPSEYSGYSSKVKAVLNFFGPTDFRRDFPPAIDMVIFQVLGKQRKDAANEMRDASPVHYIDGKSAPVFTIQGKADPLVPFAQQQWLDEKLKSAGVFHELHLIDGMGHEVAKDRPGMKEALEGAMAFLKKYVGGG